MPAVKICGLTNPNEIKAVNLAVPEYIGFVFAQSRRQVSRKEAISLKAGLSGEIKSVGVFVDAALDFVALHSGIVDIFQLHGNESEGYISELKSMTGRPVIKAFTLSTLRYSVADYILIDGENAGSGKIFDWARLDMSSIKKPLFLAGGLDPGNVNQAIAAVRPYAVDTSSGVETNGLKDPEKIKSFITRVRNERGVV